MAYTKSNYSGTIGGKNIWDYMYGLDYNLKTLEERLKCLYKLFNIIEMFGIKFSNDDFWQEIWEAGVCKSGLNTTDSLWSDTNIAHFLEKAGTYLISVTDKEEDKENIKIYDTYSEFKRGMQQEKKIKKHGEVIEYDIKEDGDSNGKPMIMLKNQKNYKLAPDIKITKKDREKYSEIEDYYKYKQYLLKLRKDKNHRDVLADKINNKKLKIKTGGDIYRFVCKQLPIVEDDMLQVKIQRDKNIVWKAPLRDSCGEKNIDCDLIDMFDPAHIKALLQIPCDKELIDEVSITKMDILNKVELTETQEIILSLWSKGVTQEEIGNKLNITQQAVNSHLDKIVSKFIDKYIEIYEDEYYYMYLVKGQYKKCSKCGEIKLIQRFDRNGKRGYMSMCKDCRR